MNQALRDARVKTTCPYCGVGCGVIATRHATGEVSVEGDPDHPANFGQLCSKGSALGDTVGLDGRLLKPRINGAPATWDDALSLVAARFAETVAAHGPDSVALYVSGQILTEDYYVANKWLKGFVGTANIDTNSRLCMASSVAGHKRAFGTDTVPGTYEDLDLADLVVLTGSNFAWCHPVLFQRLLATRQARAATDRPLTIVVIDPRRTVTAEAADLHLPIRAETDIALFGGLLKYIADVGALDHAYLDAHVNGLKPALDAVSDLTIPAVASATGVSAELIGRFYRLFSETEKTVTVYSQGVNQSARGVDKVNQILNVHLATGRVGRPGMGPFSITGQPNAMGGREVGGLANQLAAHLEIANPAHRAVVADHWHAPRIADKPGLKAVDLFDAVADGRVKAIWIMATNPVVSLPDADRVRAALAQCPFVVVSDVEAATDTLRYAHVALPALAWGEKDGTVTNSERRVSRQRAFLPAPGEARADWWQIAEVAKRMGHGAAFSYAGPHAILDDYARLTQSAATLGPIDLDLTDFVDLDRDRYDRLEPVQWPARARGPSGGRFFAEGGFFTPDRKARMIAIRPTDEEMDSTTFTLNTGRIRDQWHTMTRTGRSAKLSAHIAEPFVELHPDDAARLGLAAADLAEVASPHGRAVLRVVVQDRQRPGAVFAPMHWTGENTSAGRVNALVTPATDPISGQPASKSARVTVRAFKAGIHGFALTREAPVTTGLPYFAVGKIATGYRVECADHMAPADPIAFAARLMGLDPAKPGLDWVTVIDERTGRARIAALRDSEVEGIVYLDRAPVAVARAYAIGLFNDPVGTDLNALIAGRAGSGDQDPGRTVCACMNVGVNAIHAALKAGHVSVGAIGQATRAGTQCGSCRGEITRLIADRSLVRNEAL